MAIPLNPYVAGNPVGDSPAFIGRADVLREVVRVLRRPQDNAIVLYGQRRIGKTSILQHLTALLPREGPYRPVYFDLQDKGAWPLGRVLQDLARTVAHTMGRPDPDLDPDPETAFRQEWLPAVLGDLPEGSSLVLLFDEFDVLADPKAEQAAAAFFPYLRDLLTLAPQRLQFVFVIGRNVDDLDNIALSLFKGTPAQRISLLNREDTADLVCLSETNGTLRWPGEAVERAWQLTCGHPFLTQQLCSHVWEQAYDKEPHEPPTVTLADVDAAVPNALEASRNTLEWLWDGLPPAERVVISALAEAGPDPITQEELERLLRESGVRVVIRELQNAPRLLQDWDLIEPADSGYRFRIELLRRWMAAHKPLRRVQEELDHIEPVAENLYQAALGLYQGGQLDQAVELLHQAIALNPNHVRANQLLADILLAQGQPDEARQLLERLYEYQPAAARSRLVQAYLAEAQAAEDDDEQLTLYERVLELDSTQPEATVGRRRIWQQRGDTALEDDDLAAALGAYHKAGLTDKVAEIEQEMRRRELAARLQDLEALEQEGQYGDALDLAQKLADEYPEMREWSSDLERLERKTHLADLYQRALGALQSGDQRKAQTLLAEVIALEPGYEEASRYLHLAVTSVDVADLQSQLEAEKRAHQLFIKDMADVYALQPALVVQGGELNGQTFYLSEATIIGRSAGSDVVISDPEVSRRHASIVWEGSEPVIRDLGSSNGTFINGSRIISPQVLREGDVAQIGGTTLVFRSTPLHIPEKEAEFRSRQEPRQLQTEQQTKRKADQKAETDEEITLISLPTIQESSVDHLKSVSQQRLSPWNPLDYLRLLWWVLVTPQRRKAYQEAFGAKDEHRVGKWLASTLTWLPFFIPTLALGLGTLPHASDTWSSSTYLWLSGGLALAWFLTSLFGDDEKLGGQAILLVGVAGVVAGVVAFDVASYLASEMESELVGILAFVTGFAQLFLVAFIVTGLLGGILLLVVRVLGDGVAAIVAFAAGGAARDVVRDMTVGVVGCTAISVVIVVAVSVASGVWFVVMSSVAASMAGILAGIVMEGMEESLKTVRPTGLERGASGALLLVPAFLIWFSFLGGWRVFQ